MGQFGFLVLVIAFLSALITAIIFLTSSGAKSLTKDKKPAGVSGVYITFGLLTLAVILLEIALVGHNFSITYVADYSSREMSLPYLLSALWAGNAGSLLFWAWVLSICCTVLMAHWKEGNKELIPVAGAVALGMLSFFILLLVVIENPFLVLQTVPTDGIGLNPLLQNPAMVIHPPMLLAGYVVMTIPFAVGIAALVKRKTDDDWLSKARSWALLSWVLLGAGNIIGMWWAYVELGWGGYWAWDPVENAGLMPWLILTAFLHSVNIQRRRKTFKIWSMAMLISAFFLTIFGTFITRSNFASVHTFGTSVLEPYFGVVLTIILFGSFWLLIRRRKELRGESEIENPITREGAFFITNFLLLLSTLAILFATVFQLFFPAAVGSSFFNMVNVPIFIILIALTGLCVVLSWKKSTWKEVYGRLLIPAVLGVAALIIIIVTVGHITAALAYAAVVFGISATVAQWLNEFIKKRNNSVNLENKKTSVVLTPVRKNRYGAYIIHIGLALMAVGVIGSSVFDKEKDATLTPGQTMTINGYTLVYDDMSFSSTQSQMTVAATINVLRNDKPLVQLVPEKKVNANFEGQQTEVAIHSNLLEDVYVILNTWQSDKTASFRVLVNPLVFWIWIGGALIILGGVICYWPQRELKLITPLKSQVKKR